MIVADAHRRRGVAQVQDLDPTSSRAVAEYLSVLNDAAFGGATTWDYQEFRVWPERFESVHAIARVKRSPNRMANWALASDHSRAGMVHSFSDRFKTRNSNFIAASSVGKCPLARTALRSFEFSASIALVV